MKKDNPFTLTFGKQPDEYIARYESTNTILSTFEADHVVSQTYLIEGIRGSGKTVLMTSIAGELASRKEWVVVNISSVQDLIDDLAMRLSEAVKPGRRLHPSGLNISVAGVGVGVKEESDNLGSVARIRDLIGTLAKKNKRILITIDEVLPGQSMRQFASEFQLLVRDDYPVFLLMTGLYEHIYAIQNDPALTFLLRTPKERLQPLSMYKIARQYESILHVTEEKAKELAGITKGYAFAFQALGMLCYEQGDLDSLDSILIELDSMLDEYVYRKIWESLTGQEKKVLRAMTEPRMRVGDICKVAGMDSSNFSKYRDRLIKRGILSAPEYGKLEMALPRFETIIGYYDI